MLMLMLMLLLLLLLLVVVLNWEPLVKLVELFVDAFSPPAWRRARTIQHQHVAKGFCFDDLHLQTPRISHIRHHHSVHIYSTRTNLLPLGRSAEDHAPEGDAVHLAVPLRSMRSVSSTPWHSEGRSAAHQVLMVPQVSSHSVRRHYRAAPREHGLVPRFQFAADPHSVSVGVCAGGSLEALQSRAL